MNFNSNLNINSLILFNNELSKYTTNYKLLYIN